MVLLKIEANTTRLSPEIHIENLIPVNFFKNKVFALGDWQTESIGTIFWHSAEGMLSLIPL